MKLSKWAKQNGICYRTAYNWFKNNQLPLKAQQMPSGTIILKEELPKSNKIAIYARVSSHNKKDDLKRQVERCENFCQKNGLQIEKIYKEIASGLNDKRPKIIELLESNYETIIVEHKDRLTRFGFNYIETLLKKQNRKIIVINTEHEEENDLIKDMIAIITSFCCRLYGLRKGKNKTNKIKNEILNEK